MPDDPDIVYAADGSVTITTPIATTGAGANDETKES